MRVRRASRRRIALAIAALFVVVIGLIAIAVTHRHSASKEVSARNPLPFDLPSTTALRASDHKVFAHYFTPYPLSIDNKPSNDDYYATQYLTVNGENGKHAAYGGFLRDRPLPQPVSRSPAWQIDDYKSEIRTATAAGLDGFTVDVLSVTAGDYNWQRLNQLITAADQEDPGFKMVLMPDATSSAVTDPDALAAAMAALAAHPSVYKLDDGRLVVSPFDPEILGAGWWRHWISLMKTKYKIDVAFVPCFLDYRPNVAAFAPFSYGLSDWGYRNPAKNQELSVNIADAHRRGKIWMQAVSAQDERPYASVYDESDNTLNLRTTWNAAIKGADWVQIPTWNDYSEGTQIAPSPHTGYGLLDLNSYFLTRFKTGSWPTIKRDVLYLTHRVQFTAAHTGEPQPMRLRPGGSPPSDKVEVLAFLTGSAQVTTRTGMFVSAYTAPPGLSWQVYPLQAGTVSASIARQGHTLLTLNSPFMVTTSPARQDLAYRVVTSGR